MSKSKQITTEDKYYAILRLEKKESNQQTIANEYGINKATVLLVLKKYILVINNLAYKQLFYSVLWGCL